MPSLEIDPISSFAETMSKCTPKSARTPKRTEKVKGVGKYNHFDEKSDHAVYKTGSEDVIHLTDEEYDVVKFQLSKDFSIDDHDDLLRREYCRFLELKIRNKDVPVCPSPWIERVWQAHILSTQQYFAFCKRHNEGDYIHYDPQAVRDEHRYMLTLIIYGAKFGGRSEHLDIWPTSLASSGNDDIWSTSQESSVSSVSPSSSKQKRQPQPRKTPTSTQVNSSSSKVNSSSTKVNSSSAKVNSSGSSIKISDSNISTTKVNNSSSNNRRNNNERSNRPKSPAVVLLEQRDDDDEQEIVNFDRTAGKRGANSDSFSDNEDDDDDKGLLDKSPTLRQMMSHLWSFGSFASHAGNSTVFSSPDGSVSSKSVFSV